MSRERTDVDSLINLYKSVSGNFIDEGHLSLIAQKLKVLNQSR